MKIKITFLLFLFLSLCQYSSGQQSTAGIGYITEIASGIPQKINYSVTQKNREDKFVTNYVISDKNQNPLKGIAITNNKKQKSIDISILDLTTGAEELSYKVPYNLYGGLLINESGDSVVNLETSFSYRYLLSFDNEHKEFVNLHFLSKTADYNIMISTVSDTLMKNNAAMLREAALVKAVMKEQEEKQFSEEARHREVDSLAEIKALAMVAKMKQIESANQAEISKPGSDAFNTKLISMATAFYNTYHSDSLAAINSKNRINEHLQNMGYDKFELLEDGVSDFQDAQYSGTKEKGLPQGKGILKTRQSLFYGMFQKGKFIDGDVLIRDKAYNYTGHFSQGKYNGVGLLATTGKGAYIQLGTFNNGTLQQGIVRSTTEDSGFFGQSKAGIREGFGVSASANTLFVGEFKNGQPYSGYSKVTVDRNNIIYYGFNAGIKISLPDPQKAKPVFDALDKLKTL